MKKGQVIGCILSKIQSDPAVYGDDAEAFRPERMLDEKFEKLPKHAWKVGVHTVFCENQADLFVAFWNRCSRLYWEGICMAGSATHHCIAIADL